MAVIGIDLGTQSMKAVVVDDAMALRGEASVAYQPSFPAPGWAEQDPALWLSALRPAIAGALANSGLGSTDVKAIAIAGQLDGCVAVDRDNRALAPCIIWMDRRATAEVAGIDPDFIRERTGLVLDSTHMAANIRLGRPQPASDTSRRGLAPARELPRRRPVRPRRHRPFAGFDDNALRAAAARLCRRSSRCLRRRRAKPAGNRRCVCRRRLAHRGRARI